MKLYHQKIQFVFAISFTLLSCIQVQAQPTLSLPIDYSSLRLQESWGAEELGREINNRKFTRFNINPLRLGQHPTANSSEPLVFAAPPPPPDIGEPGRRSDAGSRGCEELNNQVSRFQKKLLTAFVPVYSGSELVLGATSSEHPTFWFYVPYQPPHTGKFVLRSQDGKSVYQTDVVLPDTPGVVSISLPSTAKPLEVDQRYHWYFKIYCQPKQPPVFVNGWIQRKSLAPVLESQLEKATLRERVALYAANGIWYEALTASAELRRTNPNDLNWAALLQAIGLEDMALEPMVDCCQSGN